MPLKKEVVAIDFGNGIDTNTSPDIVLPGKLLMLQNGSLKKGGAISKRYGGSTMSVTANVKDVSGTTEIINQSLSVFTLGDQLLMPARRAPQPTAVDGEIALMAFSEEQNRWLNKGGILSAVVKADVISNGYNSGYTAYDLIDSAVITNTQCVVTSKSSVGFIVIQDLTTKTIIASGTVAWAYLKVVAFGSFFYVFGYSSAHGISVLRLSPTTPQINSALAQLLVSDALFAYDVCITPTKIYIAYDSTGSGTGINTNSYTAAGIITGALGTPPTPSASAHNADLGTNSIAIAAHVGPLNADLEHVQIAYQNNAQGVRSIAYNGNTPGALTAIGAAFTIQVFVNAAYQITLSTDMLTNTRVAWQMSAISATDTNSVLNAAIVSKTALIAGPVLMLKGALISSRMFHLSISSSLNLNDPHYVLVCHSSTLQPTYFLVNVSLDLRFWVAARFTTGARALFQSLVTSVNTSVSMQARLAVLQLIDYDNTFYTALVGLNIDFDNDSNYQSAEIGGSVYITGGQLTHFDGEFTNELGFNLYPEGVTLADSAGGALTVAGTYQYVVVYEYQDTKGHVHRSAPSVPASIVMGGANQRVTVTIPNLRITNKGLDTSPKVKLVVYRTETLGTVFYNCSGASSPDNSKAADTQTYVDDMADSALISKPILYTTGDVLENMPPPPCNVIGLFKNRVFLGDLDVKDKIVYSKEVVAGEPLAFADEFQFSIPSVGGDCTGLIAFNDKLIIFKEERLYYLFGDGPSDTGEGGSFSAPVLINATIGCTDAKSVVECPDGILFKSQRGFYLLDPNLALSFIGAPADFYNGLRIASAVIVQSENQVRWQTYDATGPTIIYDYNLKQWFTFVELLSGNFSGRGATLWQQQYVRLNSLDGAVLQDTTFIDDGQGIPLKIKTGWISFAQVSGFQRVYRCVILGRYKSSHLLTVSISYDYNPTIIGTKIFNPAASGLNISAYSDTTNYEGVAYTGGSDMYEFRIHIPRQKCQSIQITIEDGSYSGTKESAQITSITFEVGLKQGVARMKPQASM